MSSKFTTQQPPSKASAAAPKKAKKSAVDRPKKPYKDFPLYAHNLGYWSAKVGGTILHFGRWGRIRQGKMEKLPYAESWQEALRAYKARIDDAKIGRVQGTVVVSKEKVRGELTLNDLCNRFRTVKLRLMESGEISARMYAEYVETCDKIVDVLGGNLVVKNLDSSDFENLRVRLAEGKRGKPLGPVRYANLIGRARSVFKYCDDACLIRLPYKPVLKKPSAKVMRKNKNEGGPKLFTRDEINRLLEAADAPMRAMILLGINAAYGNSDCGELPLAALDLESGWATFPRPKTHIPRRCKLWPETVEALQAALAERPKPKDPADNGLVFITAKGRHRWTRMRGNVKIDAVGSQFGKLLRRLKINGRRNLGYYSLRHTFRTRADETLDHPAIRMVMGHTDGSIDAVYRERIEDDRLEAVSAHVHDWLYGAEGGAK